MASLDPSLKAYEPRIDTSPYLDGSNSYTPDPSASLYPSLPADRKVIVDAVLEHYNGRATEKTFLDAYARESVYDDIASFADTRRKIAGHFFALPKVFSKVEVLSSEVAKNDENLIVMKMHTAYTASIPGTYSVKHLVTLGLDTSGEKPLIRYHKDQWNEKDYSHRGFGALFKRANAEGVVKIISLPDKL